MTEYLRSKNEVPDSLIKKCENLAKKNSETFFILETKIYDMVTIGESKNNIEKRDNKINSILDVENEFYISDYSTLMKMPSQYIYYDTETKSKDRYSAYSYVHGYIKSIGFRASKWNLGREYDQVYRILGDDIRLSITLKSNLIMSMDCFTENEKMIIYKGFFSKFKITKSINDAFNQDHPIHKMISRDIKINQIL